MITFLNKNQLAFLLQIKAEDARAKMCVAWARDKGINNTAKLVKKKIVDDFPFAMPIEMLSVQLGIPNLQSLVNDIHDNYLTRNATRRYILSDFPDKKLAACQKSGNRFRLTIPAPLKSLLAETTQHEIKTYWNKMYRS